MGERYSSPRHAALSASALAAACLACLLLCAAGCGQRLVPSPPAPPWSTVTGTLQLSGPLPVYYSYDGETPLSADIRVGLFQAGTSTLQRSCSPAVGAGPNALNMNESLVFYLEFVAKYIPQGSYDVALFAVSPGEAYDDWLEGPYTPVVLKRGRQFALDVWGQQETGVDFAANFTGPAPYGSISGALLISGNPMREYQPGVVLKPHTPAPGVNASTGLLWQLDESAVRHGRLPFSVPALSYGTYDVSYSGNLLRDRDDPYAVSEQSVLLSAAAPDAAGLYIKMTSTWPIVRPYEMGRISGELSLPYEPQANDIYCVEARADVMPPEGGYFDHTQAQWLLTAVDFLPETMEPGAPAPQRFAAPFSLAWLKYGFFTVSVYRLADSEEQDDTLLLTTDKPQVLWTDRPEISGLKLEVQP